MLNLQRASSWTSSKAKAPGAVLRTSTIDGDLLDQESQLLKEYQADAIVNAIGLGAIHTASEVKVYGLHGALLRLVNEGKDFPVVRNAMIVCC